MIEEILNNLYRIEVPLPKNPLKVTNSFVLTSNKRNLIIDTGFNQKECLDAMQAGLKEIEVDLAVTDFFVTHLHADHHALIPSISQAGAKIYLGDADAKRLESGKGWEHMLNYSIMNGFPAKEINGAVDNHPGRKHGPEKNLQWTHVKERDSVSVGDYAFECLETPGHTLGHICLYDSAKKLLFSGDHILGDITPNIQVWGSQDNPLKSYIDSLNKVAKLELDIILPGHRSLITNPQERIKALKDHHLARCNEVLNILKGGSRNGYQTASQMTWEINAKSWEDFPLMQKWFATGEAVAHLRFLENKDLVRRQQEKLNGIIVYELAGAEVVLQSVD